MWPEWCTGVAAAPSSGLLKVVSCMLLPCSSSGDDRLCGRNRASPRLCKLLSTTSGAQCLQQLRRVDTSVWLAVWLTEERRAGSTTHLSHQTELQGQSLLPAWQPARVHHDHKAVGCWPSQCGLVGYASGGNFFVDICEPRYWSYALPLLTHPAFHIELQFRSTSARQFRDRRSP